MAVMATGAAMAAGKSGATSLGVEGEGGSDGKVGTHVPFIRGSEQFEFQFITRWREVSVLFSKLLGF
jgi:hypothetical protein